MLALIRMSLAAPVIDERVGGAPRGPLGGVPQGGVVSPLLANISVPGPLLPWTPRARRFNDLQCLTEMVREP